MMRDGRAKGSVFVHLREYVLRTHGADAWKKLLQTMPEGERALVDELVISGGWYPVGMWNRALEAFLPAHYTKPEDGMRLLASYIAENDLNRVYKMILSVGSPSFLLKRTGSLWSRYFDTGELTSTEAGPKRWQLKLEAPTGRDEAPDSFTCGPGVVAWITSGLRLTGTEARVDHQKCRFYASPHCEYEVTW